jgi:hypothetical protein
MALSFSLPRRAFSISRDPILRKAWYGSNTWSRAPERVRMFAKPLILLFDEDIF